MIQLTCRKCFNRSKDGTSQISSKCHCNLRAEVREHDGSHHNQHRSAQHDRSYFPNVGDVSFSDTVVNKVGIESWQIKVGNSLNQQENKYKNYALSIGAQVFSQQINKHLFSPNFPSPVDPTGSIGSDAK